MLNEALATEALLEESNPPRIPIITIPLTWGVELEFVFAFRESQIELRDVVDINYVRHPSTIQKNLSFAFRRDTEDFTNPIPSDSCPDRVYNSWGIYNGGWFRNKLRPYYREAEQILSKVLRVKCPSVGHRIHESIPINEKTKDMYDEWLIMREYSVCGVGSENIPTWLPRVKSTTDWDSYGLELVSPVFKTDLDQGINEISQLLEAVEGKSSDFHGAFIMNQCGLHVHVQAPESLKVLKELAVLMIVYEAEIAKLHPQCRRPEHPNSWYQFESNRLYFVHKVQFDPRRRTYGELDISNEALARMDEHFLAEIRSEIAQCKDESELALLLNWPNHGEGNEGGNRARQVNFTTTARPPQAPRTIEFRQARGTLDANDVQKWVEFCVGLVRLAQYYVDNPGTFPIKTFKSLLVDEGEGSVRERFYVMDLMKDMGMPEEDKEYWRERMARFQGRGGRLDRLDNEKAPLGGEDGQGIPGGNGGDDPGDGLPGGNGKADDAAGNDPGRNNHGGNGSSGGGNPPLPSKPSPDFWAEEEEDGEQSTFGFSLPPPPKDNDTSLKAGDKRSAEDDESKEGLQFKRPKIDTTAEISDSEEDDQKQSEGTSNIQANTDATGASTDSNLALSPARAGRFLDHLAGLYKFATSVAHAAALALHHPLAAPPLDIPPDFEMSFEGMVAPAGTLSDEALIFTGAVWAVRDFDFSRWVVQDASIWVGWRSHVCAINAILQSMRSQYPNSNYNDMTAPTLLAMFDRLTNRQVHNDEADHELALVVDHWTRGEYQVVVVSSEHKNKVAYRGGFLNQHPLQRLAGRNLYVHHLAYAGEKKDGHWEGMRRKRPDEW